MGRGEAELGVQESREAADGGEAPGSGVCRSEGGFLSLKIGIEVLIEILEDVFGGEGEARRRRRLWRGKGEKVAEIGEVVFDRDGRKTGLLEKGLEEF